MAAEVGEIHVLLVAFAAQGHLNPMLKFGRRLLTKGLKVTLATTHSARERLSNIKASSSNSTNTTTCIEEDHGGSHEIRLEFFSDGMAVDSDRLTHMDYFFQQIGEHGPGNLTKLIHDVYHSRGLKLHCIINNPFVPWVANVADDLRLPCAMLWIQPCALYATYYRYYKGLNEFPSLDGPAGDTSPVVHLPGLPPLKKEDLPSFLLPSNAFPTIPKVLSQCFGDMEIKVRWVLGNSFYELEKSVVDSMESVRPIIPVGPLVPPALLGEDEDVTTSSGEDSGTLVLDMWKPDENCLRWLDRKPPGSVVYISFGSLVVLTPKEIKSFAQALTKSNFPFLWVVKPGLNHHNEEEEEMDLTTLKELIIRGDEEDHQGLVVKWCPQTKVLSHPSLACFVTHCGWNSTLETVTAGVPVIAYPHWTDQPTNAKLLVDVFEMGVRMRADESDGMVTEEEVTRCIAEVMTGPKSAEMKASAAKWKEAARAAVGHGGSSDRNIQTFVEEIISLGS